MSSEINYPGYLAHTELEDGKIVVSAKEGIYVFTRSSADFGGGSIAFSEGDPQDPIISICALSRLSMASTYQFATCSINGKVIAWELESNEDSYKLSELWSRKMTCSMNRRDVQVPLEMVEGGFENIMIPVRGGMGIVSRESVHIEPVQHANWGKVIENISNLGKTVWACGNQLCLWDHQKEAVLDRISPHKIKPITAATGFKTKHYVTADGNKKLILWELKVRGALETKKWFKERKSTTLSEIVKYLAPINAEYFASSFATGNLALWDQSLNRLKNISTRIPVSKLCSLGASLIACQEDTEIKIRDWKQSGKPIETINHHHLVTGMLLSERDQSLITISQANELKIVEGFARDDSEEELEAGGRSTIDQFEANEVQCFDDKSVFIKTPKRLHVWSENEQKFLINLRRKKQFSFFGKRLHTGMSQMCKLWSSHFVIYGYEKGFIQLGEIEGGSPLLSIRADNCEILNLFPLRNGHAIGRFATQSETKIRFWQIVSAQWIEPEIIPGRDYAWTPSSQDQFHCTLSGGLVAWDGKVFHYWDPKNFTHRNWQLNVNSTFGKYQWPYFVKNGEHVVVPEFRKKSCVSQLVKYDYHKKPIATYPVDATLITHIFDTYSGEIIVSLSDGSLKKLRENGDHLHLGNLIDCSHLQLIHDDTLMYVQGETIHLISLKNSELNYRIPLPDGYRCLSLIPQQPNHLIIHAENHEGKKIYLKKLPITLSLKDCHHDQAFENSPPVNRFETFDPANTGKLECMLDKYQTRSIQYLTKNSTGQIQKQDFLFVVKELKKVQEEMKAKKNEDKLIKQILQCPQLANFYRRFQKKIVELFISANARNGGAVEGTTGRVAKIGDAFELLGNVVDLAPFVGKYFDKAIKFTAVEGCKILDKRIEDQKAQRISDLATTLELVTEAEKAARYLTKCFQSQLEQISPSEAGFLAEFGVKGILEALEKGTFSMVGPLHQQFIKKVIALQPTLYDKHQLGCTLTAHGKRWNLRELFSKVGVKIEDQKFTGPNTDPETYGYCNGEMWMVELRGLTKNKN